MRMILAPPIATNLDSHAHWMGEHPSGDHIKRPEVGLSGAMSYTKTIRKQIQLRSKDLQINVKDLHKNQCSKGMLLAQPLQGLRHLVGKGCQVVLDLKWLKEWTHPFQNSSERISRWKFLPHVSPKSCTHLLRSF